MEYYNTLIDAFLDSSNISNKIVTIDSNQDVQEIDYKTLQMNAKKFANYFNKNGLVKGDKVIVSIGNVQTFIYAFWGAVLIGAEIVPVIPPQNGLYLEGKSNTIKFLSIIDIISPKCIITSDNEVDNIKNVIKGSQKILTVSREILSDEVEFNETVQVSNDEPVIVLFTSGSTGVPKGVEISHKKALTGCYKNIEMANWSIDTNFLNWLPLEHIASLMLYHLLPTILKANQVQVYTNEILKDVKNWLYYLSKYSINTTFTSDFIFGLLLEQKDQILKSDISLDSVVRVIDGGEPINYKVTNECVEMLQEKGFSSSALVSGWGMTEIGNGAIYSNSFGSIMYNNCVAIGKPIKDLEVRIVKDGKLITNEEVEGVLEIKADYILDRYLNETQEEHLKRFTNDGWFKTGDLVVWKSGEIVITGRESNIFILNGVNISTIEIEKYLKEVLSTQDFKPTIKAISIKDENNHDDIYIFVEYKNDTEKDTLASTIKNSMVERYGFSIDKVVFIKEGEFPRTSIGKVDGKSLTEGVHNGVYQVYKKVSKHDNSNLSDEESLMLFIWSDVLNIEKDTISVEDDFFNLGGNSAKVPTALDKINSVFETNINASEFVKYSTISKLLKYIHTNDTSNGEDDEEEEIILL